MYQRRLTRYVLRPDCNAWPDAELFYLALIVYEHAITLHREVVFMWQWKFSAVTALFVINRYGALAYGILAVVSGLVSDHEVTRLLLFEKP